MGTRGHVGAVNPDGTVTIRYVHSETYDYLPYAIARIWWATFHRNTADTAAALIEHDWEYLDPSTTVDCTHWSGGGIAVAGVGMAIGQPFTEGPVCGRPGELGGLHGNLFLLDAARPGRLLISDGCDPAFAPVFDLTVGERVVITPDEAGG